MGEFEGDGIEMRPNELEGVVGDSDELLDPDDADADETETDRARPRVPGIAMGSEWLVSIQTFLSFGFIFVKRRWKEWERRNSAEMNLWILYMVFGVDS